MGATQVAQEDTAFMPLSAAALIAYYNLLDKPPPAANGAELARRVDAIATALVGVTPVYLRDERTGFARQLSRAEFILTGLPGGAAAQRDKLYIRKTDLLHAIAALKEAHQPA